MQVEVRRAFDVAVAAIGVTITAPLWSLIAVGIKLDSPGPILFRSPRVGLNGRSFTLLKFRTMTVSPPEEVARITRGDDPRITRFGKVLRRHKLDELPQFLNVLRGDMSIVGPRPEDPAYVALYTSDQRQVLDVRPGMASVASLRYLREETLLQSFDSDWEKRYASEVMPDKLLLELDYESRRTILSDLLVLCGTLVSVGRRR
jgi:lipopolysaccharide/colanic/teichoic acid biosynthesis glycosyltransferase